MNTKPQLILISLICFLLISASAQEKPKKCYPATTNSKTLIGTIQLNERETIEIIGKATYTVTDLYSDLSVVGTLVLTLSDVERQKIARAMNRVLNEIPPVISQQKVLGQFHKLTECPVLQFDFSAMELEIAGEKMQLKRFTLNLQEGSGRAMPYFCTIARQLKNGLPMHVHRFYDRIKAAIDCQIEKD